MSRRFTVKPVVLPDDIEDVITFMNRTFLVDEPLNAALGLGDDGPCQELDEYCKETLLEDFSFKAVDDDGNLVGVIINGISSLENKADFFRAMSEECKNLKFGRILSILAQREDGAKLQERFPDAEKMVAVDFAATDPGWRKCGIMKELLRVTEKAVIEKGIKLVRMDTSSYYSSRSAETLGYTRVYSARYEDIKKDGIALILPAPPHVVDCVYMKLLKDK